MKGIKMKRKKLLLVGIVFIITLSLTTNCFAFRCGNKLIYKGSKKSKILNCCGEPSKKLFEVIDGIGCAEIWIINLGPNKYVRYVYFKCNRDTALDIKQSDKRGW